jgi:hypothetical protein
MGLDMYLEKKTYVSISDRNGLKVTGLTSAIDPSKVKYIIEEAGYWRKANAIHQWFVENVQDGEDDCKEYEVSAEQMEELLDLVKKVLKVSVLVKGKIHNGTTWTKGKKIENYEDGMIVKNPATAKKLLPTTSGFFFGGTEYDQYYIQDLKDTEKILEEALKDKSADFSYQSSW